jgi:hypothetical protein
MSGLIMKPENFSLSYSTDGGTVYNEIPNINSFDPGEEKSDTHEVTTFSSPDNRKEYRNGLIDADEASFEINWIFANIHHNALRDAVGGAALKFKATLLEDDGATGEEIVFDALVKGVTRPIEMEGKLTATMTLRPTGAAVITPTV